MIERITLKKHIDRFKITTPLKDDFGKMYLLPKLHKCLDNGPGSPIISNPCYTYVRRKLLNF